MARANEHWRAFDGRAQALAVFSGSHAYVSPNWYASEDMAPTWNYALVHAAGRPRMVDDPDAVIEVLRRSAAVFETDAAGSRTLEAMDAAPLRSMPTGIVAFEMSIERLEGKFETSRNRRPEATGEEDGPS